MDVDLLRPGTVPISPDTILWFEFLLNPSLLEKHLAKTKPEPSATDLIVSFLSIASEKKDEETGTATEPVDITKGEENGTKRNRKSLALKILALKVAAFLKWDLSILESKLPLTMQQTLLQSLLFICLDCDMDVSRHSELNLSNSPCQVVFAVVLYHRWVLRAIMHNRISIRQTRLPNVSIPGLQDPGNIAINVLEDILRRLETQAPNSVELLSSQESVPPPSVPVFETFIGLTEDSLHVKQDWDKGIKISSQEFLCQIHFDLASYLLFREQNESARESMQKAATLYEHLKSSNTQFSYCSINEETFNGYCQALELTTSKRDLLSQLQHSIHNQYTGIVTILQQDNIHLQIPQMYRDILEFDIQGAVTSGKFTVARDLLFQVQTLNLVCRALKGLPNYTTYWQKLHQSKVKGVDILVNAILAVISSSIDDQRKQRLKQLIFLGIVEYSPLREWIAKHKEIKELFTFEELTKMNLPVIKSEQCPGEITEDSSDVPDLLLSADWGHNNLDFAGDSRLESGALEQQLIRSYDHQEVHKLLIKLGSLNPGKVLWKINNKWELPIPLQGVVTSLPRFLQDYCYILLAKARELTAMKDFVGAQQFLSTVEKEAKPGNQFSNILSYKLLRLVGWETLLVQITHFHTEWPSSGINTEQLIAGCKQCLSTLKSGDNVIPRLEILEQCALCLLNLGQWEYLSLLEKRWNYFELATALASACFDVARFKGNKKVCKDAWDIVLPVFGPSQQQKRSSSGAASIMHRDSPTHCGSVTTRAGLYQVLATLRDPIALAVAISLLARLNNVLRDEPTFELNVEYTGLWPATVSNANSYYARAVSEMLGQLLALSLRFHPTNTSWLKLLADLNFVMGHYAASLKCYLEVAVLVSDFFSQPLPRGVMDDHVYRRMIKCCTNLQCHTQAAVLCQFLEEIDYSTAFKSLGGYCHSLNYHYKTKLNEVLNNQIKINHRIVVHNHLNCVCSIWNGKIVNKGLL
ncbi:Integrator complex subunit 8 [Gryllus bimaculatus]|nr:Integrator complex subunit 8 [Gryllus bimaculatus]